MERKIVVIGYTTSGKTTYLTGMYATMKGGIKNFSLIAKEPDTDERFDILWHQMVKDGTSPLPTAPTATETPESYVFKLIHNLETEILEFEWIDYPGSFLNRPTTKPYQQLLDVVAEADCLMIIVNGEFLVVNNPAPISSTDYEVRLSNQLTANTELNAEINCLNALVIKGIQLPPIIIAVTKSDLIDVQYANIFRKVLRERFQAILEAPGRIVMQVAVSLGGPIQKNFTPRPTCLEEPVIFASLEILTKAIRKAQNIIEKYANFIDEHDGFIDCVFRYTDQLEEYRLSIFILRRAIPVWSANCLNLIKAFSVDKTIYIGGTEKKMYEYYDKTIKKISVRNTFSNWVEITVKSSSQSRNTLHTYYTRTIEKLSAEFPIKVENHIEPGQ